MKFTHATLAAFALLLTPISYSQTPNSETADKSKAVGDALQDLVYTPVTPCRLFDSRAGQASALGQLGGVMTAQSRRTLNVGGQCGIPATGVASVFISFHAYNNAPATLGIISFMKPGDALTAMAATWTGSNWATGTFIAGTNASGAFDVFVGNPTPSMTADMVVDVTGYFMPPNRGGNGLRVYSLVNRDGMSSTNVVNGSVTNQVAVGIVGATISGGGGYMGNFNLQYPNSPFLNQVTADFGTVGGGNSNTSGYVATIGGGVSNRSDGYASFIGGGSENQATADLSTIVGGRGNLAAGSRSSIGGGENNVTSAEAAVVSGGVSNRATGWASGVSGGNGNKASGFYSGVTFGSLNRAEGLYSSVVGGLGNHAKGAYGFVLGRVSLASGDFSFAGGHGAKTQSKELPIIPHNGAFLWSDSIGELTTEYFHSTTNNQFAVRSRGGVAFRVASTDNADTGAGCALPAGGAASWSCSSDRNLKEAVKSISPQTMLNKVLALPVTSWQFIGTNRRHIGPMAQDFRAAFGLGADDKNITTSDVSGVALAAIQGLNQKLEAERAKNKAKEAEIAALKADLALIKKKLGL